MDIDSHKFIDATAGTVFDLLMDPAVLVATMPGLKQMSEKDQGIYNVIMELGVPGFKGTYAGTLEIGEIHAPSVYRLSLEGEGPNGTITMDLAVKLQASDNGRQTDLHYKGTGHFGSANSGMGQRVLSGASNVILKQFFGDIAKRARQYEQGR